MAFSKDTLSKCSEHLSAYKAACEEHPDLKSFDSSLQQRTNKVIDSLTVEDETGLLSQHALHIEVSNHLLEVQKDLADFILKSEDDVWENKALKSLVLAYFDSTIETLEIFDTIVSCVDEAEMGELIIKQAVAEFDKELAEDDVGGKKKKYEKTLEKLKKFKAMGDPFDDLVFTTQFELLKKQLDSLLENVSALIKKVHEDRTKLQKGSRILNVVLGAVFGIVTVAAISLVATRVAEGAGEGIEALEGPLLLAGWPGVYTNLELKKNSLKRKEENLKKVKDTIPQVEIGVVTNEEALKTVSQVVHQLETKILFILSIVDNAMNSVKAEEDASSAMQFIKEKVTKLTKEIKLVGENVTKNRELVVEARYKVQKKILG